MHGVRRERRKADRDVFCALRVGRTVTDPLARVRHNRLTGANIHRAAFVLDAQHSTKDDRDLFELRSLTGSTHPDGDTMRATLTAACPLFTRPANSSMRLGFVPAALMTDGASMSRGIRRW